MHKYTHNLQAVTEGTLLNKIFDNKKISYGETDGETGGGGRLRDEYWGIYIFLRCLSCQFYDIWSYILYWDHGPEIWTLTVKKVSSKIIWLDRVVAQVLGSQNRTTRAALFQFYKATTVQLYNCTTVQKHFGIDPLFQQSIWSNFQKSADSSLTLLMIQ